jgi:hypothetical protein
MRQCSVKAGTLERDHVSVSITVAPFAFPHATAMV